MQLTIYFTPAEVATVRASALDVYIVIDLIRATTSMTTILDRGASRIYAAQTIEQAQEASRYLPGALLCGERNALQLPGFDLGNSPVQFLQAELIGKELVLTTTNGTRAFFACPPESVRLAGCFYNAQAVTSYALSQATNLGSNIAIVCAGEYGYFPLDDAVCAGYLAQMLIEQTPTLELHESVYAALALYQTYAPPKLLEYCRSARSVINAGLRADLDICVTYNASSSIARVTGKHPHTELLILERVPIAL
ncbi:2-phosphosulfolactate phosphatase [Thermosporothrix hazakensis]|jgi:2-phosphosulfolactate phosphatase|uniref:Probable 2-phosphosulfolactate phosphatase n=1 Tax=Thermosporothrix hazakensis TaxID=644383 RepID=A0A326UE17_THEHA|nr:2-phosphosulfolactate phosphatase [Thermosporothrix hazakensis]PZW36842.1 2-phosphosulfolactate phosphatase [Thermosporothrix hazakensis]GCE47490.1 putative 2-phosphosulfolactate phosphatase [Thermosporothrix hazakensis]